MTAFWGTTSASAPALLGNSRDEDLLTWVASDSTLNIAWAAEVDASKGPVSAPGTETAVGRPSMAGTPQGAVVAWSGTDGSSTLNIASIAQLTPHDPLAFSQKATLWGVGAPAGTAAAWSQGRLYLAWADAVGQLHLGWSADPFTAATWAFTELPESAIDAPSIASFPRGGISMVWAGTDGNGTINYADGFTPGRESDYVKVTLDGSEAARRFFTKATVRFEGSDTSPVGPQVQLDADFITVAYTGHDQALYLLSFHYQDANFDRFKCHATSDMSPAISGDINAGGIAWRGLDGGHTLNLSTDPYTDLGAVQDNGGG